MDEVDKLVYLKAALTETLRLYPSVLEDSETRRGRRLAPRRDIRVSGIVHYVFHILGREDEVDVGDDYLEFKPERWLSPDGKQFVMQDQFRFVAFNAGPWICLGKDLAYLQMKSVAAAVLLRHWLTVLPGHKV